MLSFDDTTFGIQDRIPILIIKKIQGFPAWSPDGALLAFQTNRDGNWEIYVIHSDGSDPLNLTQDPADDQMPYWK